MPGEPESKSAPEWPSLRGFLCRLFERLGARSHDAEDLAQESLARAIRKRRPDDRPVSFGFVAAIGRNLWRDRLRVRMRRGGHETTPPGEEIPSDVATPLETATRNEETERLRAAIAGLDPRHRDAIMLVVIEGRTYAEAATILGVPRGTMKSRIHYGMQRLRERLGVEAPAEARREGGASC